MNDRKALAILSAWLVVAAIFTHLGGLRALPPPFPQALLAALVLFLAVTYALRRSFRSWLDGLPSYSFLTLHLSRFVGFYFLVLFDRGELPYEFAVLGGWGDIAVATFALGLLAAFRGGPTIHSPWLHIWNIFGLLDILFVVSTAVRSVIVSPESMAPLLQLPLGLLPTFLVPLIIFTHSVLLVRGVVAFRKTNA